MFAFEFMTLGIMRHTLLSIESFIRTFAPLTRGSCLHLGICQMSRRLTEFYRKCGKETKKKKTGEKKKKTRRKERGKFYQEVQIRYMTAKLLICVLLLPVIAALAIVCLWDLRRQKELRIVTCGTQAVMAVLLWYLAATGKGSQTLTLFSLTDDFSVTFAADMLGRYFAAAAVTVWLAVMIFLSVCLDSRKHETRFFLCSLLIPGTVTGACYAANFMTMFLFLELTVFLFLPLVMHYQTEASDEEGRRYFLGAFLGGLVSLMGACCFSMYVSDLGFVTGGALDATFAGGKNRLVILIAVSLMVAGFGMLSHAVSECGWLPGVERDIPVTVQALGAGVIANLGMFAAIRSVYYLVGADYLFGSGAQIFLILFAVLMSVAGILLMWRTGRNEDTRLGRKYGQKRLLYILLNQAGYSFLLLAIFQPAGLYLAIGYAAVHMLMSILVPVYNLMKE